MRLLIKKHLLALILLAQVLPTLPIAHSGFDKLKAGDVLQMNRYNRIPRSDGNNFDRFYRNNQTLGSNYILPAGSKVRYTGKYTERPGGNFGVQVELMSGVEPEHVGKLVWIYYRNNEQTIRLTTEKVKPGKLRNDADIAEKDDIIRSYESPSDFFGDSHKLKVTEVTEIPEVIQDAQKSIENAGRISLAIPCTDSTCNPENSDIDSQLTKELNDAISTSSAIENVTAAGIPNQPLLRALHFYNENKNKRNLQDRFLVVADLTQPSNQKRMYKIDLKTGKVLKYTTSHGSGYSNGAVCANTFGNRRNSNLSSGGGYVTGSERTFKGHHALNLHGVEVGRNDNVFNRGVLLHRASYVGDNYAGRTFGCLSIQSKYSDEFILSLQGYGPDSGYIEKGAAIYVYPDRDDLLDKNAYWDSSCKSELAKRNRHPTWIK